MIEHPVEHTHKAACHLCGGIIQKTVEHSINIATGKGQASNEATEAKPPASTKHDEHDHEACRWNEAEQLVRELESRPDPD